MWAQVLLAQADGTWQRLELYREPACRSAFHDRSRNNSGVWHDVRRCGNAADLRTSRARRKQQAAEAPAGE
ncbi:CGNR zinc finger domain-containing protein [Streptomyces sp. DSM 41972]|uniref:CGNR zinc finger domain-containing protein n=1 Tax=Streptomyces althioticus subsp. attaecolombicae TaxID=3075534 RepID=A0ABU3I2C0_9ACTN|nr:CGNR zinc finger domain-containing protein [Streptomyces sp. DSM 41972]SCD78901.1 CGNR zinc finger domain-containing protein [Streptomyces sp. di50b]SCD90036.1 CGNR zinc finger domain-containing protein [Streptomyces sp. di188]